MKKYIKFIVLGLLVALVVGFWDTVSTYASLEYVKSQQEKIAAFYENNQVLFPLLFFLGYVAVTALALPAAAIMTLLAGAIFGLGLGAVIVSFASSTGATIAFLLSRFVLGETLQAKYADKLDKFNQGFEREGPFFLFAMRLIPAFPFFLINILMGLTKIKAFTFYWVSQLGMLAGTIVYVNAGKQLSTLDSLSGLLSFNIIASFVALALVPIIAKQIVKYLRKRKGVDG